MTLNSYKLTVIYMAIQDYLSSIEKNLSELIELPNSILNKSQIKQILTLLVSNTVIPNNKLKFRTSKLAYNYMI